MFHLWTVPYLNTLLLQELNVTLVRRMLFDSVGTNVSVVLTLISAVHAMIGVQKPSRTGRITQCNASSSSQIAKFSSRMPLVLVIIFCAI